MLKVRSFLASLCMVSLLLFQGTIRPLATESDPKAACRAEEVITSIAGRPPDKLDFLGERLENGSFGCEAYFTYDVYGVVWRRLDALATTLKDVEGICLINGLQKLPRLDALQINYVITAAGQLRITSVSDGLPAAPTKLSQRLKSALARLEQVRDADDRAIINDFVRKSCPEANY